MPETEVAGTDNAASAATTTATEKTATETATKTSGAAETATTLATDAGDAPDKEGAATWPDDWRQRWAGKDDKELARLNRFKSPENVYKSFRELEKKQNEKLVGPKKPGTDASPEDVAAYRQQLGIPEKPEEYIEKAKLPDGWQLGDDDKPVAISYAKAMHAMHAPQEFVDAGLGWYHAEMEERAAAQVEADTAFKTESRDALRDELGSEFRMRINSIPAAFDEADRDVKDADSLMSLITTARDASGRILGDNPRVLKWLMDVANDRNPVAAVMPGGAASGGRSIDDEIAEIERVMASDKANDEYWKNPAKQDRYSKLLEARQKRDSRRAA